MAAAFLTALASQARAQDDGPRVYQLTPVGAKVVTAFLVNKRGNETAEAGSTIPGARIDTDILVFRYAQTFDLMNRALAPFVILPLGEVRQSSAPASSGLGDMQLGASLGLIGAPALSPERFAAFKPGFGMGLLGRVYLPTGAYSAAHPVNLGSNRLAFQLGLPAVLAAGRSYRDPALTSLEVLPTVTLYQTNPDPFAADRSAKAPLYSVEAHLTRNLGQRVWLSADILYRLGGATTTDGVNDHNGMHGWSAGLSVAVPFAGRSSVIFTYERVVERSDTGPDGWFFRTAVVKTF